jgi:hypothetical protein
MLVASGARESVGDYLSLTDPLWGIQLSDNDIEFDETLLVSVNPYFNPFDVFDLLTSPEIDRVCSIEPELTSIDAKHLGASAIDHIDCNLFAIFESLDYFGLDDFWNLVNTQIYFDALYTDLYDFFTFVNIDRDYDLLLFDFNYFFLLADSSSLFDSLYSDLIIFFESIHCQQTIDDHLHAFNLFWKLTDEETYQYNLYHDLQYLEHWIELENIDSFFNHFRAFYTRAHQYEYFDWLYLDCYPFLQPFIDSYEFTFLYQDAILLFNIAHQDDGVDGLDLFFSQADIYSQEFAMYNEFNLFWQDTDDYLYTQHLEDNLCQFFQYVCDLDYDLLSRDYFSSFWKLALNLTNFELLYYDIHPFLSDTIEESIDDGLLWDFNLFFVGIEENLNKNANYYDELYIFFSVLDKEVAEIDLLTLFRSICIQAEEDFTFTYKYNDIDSFFQLVEEQYTSDKLLESFNLFWIQTATYVYFVNIYEDLCSFEHRCHLEALEDAQHYDFYLFWKVVFLYEDNYNFTDFWKLVEVQTHQETLYFDMESFTLLILEESKIDELLGSFVSFWLITSEWLEEETYYSNFQTFFTLIALEEAQTTLLEEWRCYWARVQLEFEEDQVFSDFRHMMTTAEEDALFYKQYIDVFDFLTITIDSCMYDALYIGLNHFINHCIDRCTYDVLYDGCYRFFIKMENDCMSFDAEMNLTKFIKMSEYECAIEEAISTISIFYTTVFYFIKEEQSHYNFRDFWSEVDSNTDFILDNWACFWKDVDLERIEEELQLSFRDFQTYCESLIEKEWVFGYQDFWILVENQVYYDKLYDDFKPFFERVNYDVSTSLITIDFWYKISYCFEVIIEHICMDKVAEEFQDFWKLVSVEEYSMPYTDPAPTFVAPQSVMSLARSMSSLFGTLRR